MDWNLTRREGAGGWRLRRYAPWCLSLAFHSGAFVLLASTQVRISLESPEPSPTFVEVQLSAPAPEAIFEPEWATPAPATPTPVESAGSEPPAEPAPSPAPALAPAPAFIEPAARTSPDPGEAQDMNPAPPEASKDKGENGKEEKEQAAIEEAPQETSQEANEESAKNDTETAQESENEKAAETAETPAESPAFGPPALDASIVKKLEEERRQLAERQKEVETKREKFKQSLQGAGGPNPKARKAPFVSDGEIEGAVRRLDLTGFPKSVVDRLMGKYDITIQIKRVSALDHRSIYLNAAETDKGVYRSQRSSGLFEVFTLSPQSVRRMVELEEAEMKRRGLNPVKTRVVEVVFAPMAVGGDVDFAIKEFQYESLE